MPDQYWVRPEELRARASGYSGVGDRLEDALARLQSTLAAAGACWGEDPAGQRFARAYSGPAGTAQQAFREFAGGLGAIRRKLGTMADNYERADLAGAERFGSGDVA